MRTEEDIFKAGLWHGLALLERKLIELGLCDGGRLEHIADALVAEFEALPTDIKRHALSDGFAVVDFLRGQSPFGRKSLQ